MALFGDTSSSRPSSRPAGKGRKSGASKSTQRKASRNPEARRRARRMRRRHGLIRSLFTIGNITRAAHTGITLLVLGMLALAYFMHDLPDISNLVQTNKAHSIVLRTEDGDIIGSSGDIYGEYIEYKDIPQGLIMAVVATEDRNYFEHHGIDPFGLLRATFVNLRAGKIVQGGSTLTQQLAKNIFLTAERSLKRKVQEIILALWMEKKYSKQEILSVYLNRVYFGAGTYGVDAASRRYFGKSARKMTLAESAMIAGLLKAPSRYSPSSNPDLAKGRATQVLLNMVDAGMLTQKQMEKAKATYTHMTFPTVFNSSGRRYFVDWILEQIPDYIGNIDTDLVVTTTFDPRLQELAEASVKVILDEKTTESMEVGQVALLSMTPDGAVRAMIGGRDYATSQFNRSTQAQRQPGSSFKLFVYLAALEHGYQPLSTMVDQPIIVDGWEPKNYDGSYVGEIPLREALAKSINTVAVQLSESAGRGHVIEMAHRLGLKAEMEPVPSIALGVTETTLLEMTTAFAHLAANGESVIPFGIKSIQDTHGNPIYERSSGALGRVLQPEIVARMNDMLMAVVEEGTGAAANIGRPVAGKTGTSQDFRDAWFVGFTPDLVTGVWVGNDNGQSMSHVTGGRYPARVWHNYMQPALANVPARGIPREQSGGGFFFFGPSPAQGPNPAQGPQYAPSRHNQPGQQRHFWDQIFSGGSEAPRNPKQERIKR